ncbi:unnamed protein product [Symbiodinium necroappetens]|uniref:Uncharacterized protein n=1 Tax=Symbiodinium necroappetens TaxID=1628268 RepID=A0A813A048_9DINO|nr:unnamed protein product [Symbiodinium necroappetens]
MIWPDKGLLSQAWESDTEVRQCFRAAKSHLLVWPSVQLVGAVSMKALSMNVPAVKVALQIWGDFSEDCKAMPIDWLKQEVQELHLLLNPATTNRAVAVYVDAWGVKRLSSLAMRRWRSPIGQLRDSLHNFH